MQDPASGSPWVIPMAILATFVVGFAIVRFIMSCWKTVPPNMVAVVYGRRHGGKGYKIVKGGGFLRIPILEQVAYLPLNVLQIPIEVTKAPDQKGVRIDVKAMANVKIESADEALSLAIERFLNRSEDQIKGIAKENLEGNLRSLVGTLQVEELIRDRAKFQGAVLQEAAQDMAKLGLKIDLLNIQAITDENGYIEALGKKQTAETVESARIGQANAKRDADIQVAQADQAARIAEAKSTEAISNATRERDTVKAHNDAQVRASQARIEIVAESAAAEEQLNLNVARVAAEQGQTEAEIKLQETVRRRTEAQLNATMIVQAEKTREAELIQAESKKQALVIGANAQREALVIQAEAAQAAAVNQGEAFRIKAEKEGQGTQAKMVAEAEGRKAEASALQIESEAKAAGRKAELLAEAAGIEAKGLADAKANEAKLLSEANGRKALLLAEAEGAMQKAEAFKVLDASGKMLLILEHLPAIITAAGDAVGKAISPAAEAIGEGLGNVKEIRLVDLGVGGVNGNGKGNVLSQFINSPVEALFAIVRQADATGMGAVLRSSVAKMGIDLDAVLNDAKHTADGSVTDVSTTEVVRGK